MKRYPSIALFTFLGYFFFAVAPVGCASAHNSPAALFKIPLDKITSQIQRQNPAALTAGVAKVEITPAVGTPLAGYSKRKGKPSTGIRDPLYVRALAISDGKDTAVFVSADILIFPRPLAEAILKQVASDYKIPRQAVVLSATHTHSGIGAIAPGFLYEMVFGDYDEKVMEGLKARVLWAIKQALDHQQSAQWGINHGSITGVTENRKNPLGATDSRVGVFLMESAKKEVLVVIVNAAAHPTLLGSQEMRFSADFPGETTRLLEAAYPGSVCFFMNGAAGDLRPSGDLGNGPEEKIRRFSESLTEKVVGLINQTELSAKGDLVSWGWRVALPSPQMRIGPVPIPSLVGRLMRPTSTYINLIALDNAVFVPLQAELTTELGQTLRHRLILQGADPVLIGYSNGYLGYAVTAKEYRDGGYESWMTWYGPYFGEMMVDGIELLASPYAKREKDKD